VKNKKVKYFCGDGGLGETPWNTSGVGELLLLIVKRKKKFLKSRERSIIRYREHYISS
jgi:hypothetical protein